MVDLGFWEFALIFVVVILVFGPERIPELAKTLGNWYAKVMRLAHNARRDFERELNLTDLHKLIQEQRQQIHRLQSEMQTVKREFESDVLAEDAEKTATTATEEKAMPAASTADQEKVPEEQPPLPEKKQTPLSPAEIAAANNAELLRQREEEMVAAKTALDAAAKTASDSKDNA